MIKLAELLKLIKAVKDSDFSEVEYEGQEVRLVLRRRVPLQPVAVREEQPPETPRSHLSSAAENDLIEVSAPMVGTFYRAPSPGAEPFVKPGDKVAPGDTLCILEAMKLMNEIQSEIEGEVAAVKVENGELVEYGQVLFALRPLKA